MWLGLCQFIMSTVIVSNHFNELDPYQSGPILMCYIFCYAFLLSVGCKDYAAVPLFSVWAFFLMFILTVVGEKWSYISALWVFSAICLQMAMYLWQIKAST